MENIENTYNLLYMSYPHSENLRDSYLLTSQNSDGEVGRCTLSLLLLLSLGLFSLFPYVNTISKTEVIQLKILIIRRLYDKNFMYTGKKHGNKPMTGFIYELEEDSLDHHLSDLY